ncbi:MAG: protein-export chaperone SecB [Alphaproteobacteria bacterium]
MSDGPPEDQPKSNPARAEAQAAKSDATNRGGAGEVSVNTLAQYVKDLSFENPNAPKTLNDEQDAPAVDMDIRVDTEKVGKDTYEVALIMRATAVSAEKTLFLVDLTYCGLFSLSNVPQDQIAPILRIHCPMLLFPFARNIVADATRNGGYPPLLINLIDFAQLYQQRRSATKKRTEAKAAQKGNENGE